MNESGDSFSSCRNCGAQLTRRFCTTCGSDSQCASCGATLNGPFCGECGTPTTEAQAGTGRTPGQAAPPSKANLPKWLAPLAIAAAIALLAGIGIAIALGGKPEKASSSEPPQGVTESTSTTTTSSTTTTTQLATTTVPTTAVPVACPTDAASLKAPVVKAGVANSSYMTHMGIDAGSIKYTMGTKYIYFTLSPIDNLGGQGGGMFLRCDAGTWTYLTVVDGMSCLSGWTGDDRAAAVTFRIC